MSLTLSHENHPMFGKTLTTFSKNKISTSKISTSKDTTYFEYLKDRLTLIESFSSAIKANENLKVFYYILL